jgi:Acyl-CoA dehydrogenase, N-terminal domain
MSSAEVDFLKLDLLLSDEEKLARDSVHAFVNERINPIIAECYEKGRFPMELIRRWPNWASWDRLCRKNTDAQASTT